LNLTAAGDSSVSEVRQHSIQAIGFMLVSVFFMSTMDVAIKILVEHYSSFQVVFLRCALSFPLFAAWILITGKSQFRTAYPWGHLLRGLLGVVMLFAVGECFREMQLADAYTLFFAAPLLITLLSGPVLGEPAGSFRIFAAVLGFGGVLIVLSPSAEGWITYGALMGLIGMAAYAFTTLLLRRLGSRDGTVTIAFWFVTIVGAISGILAIPQWKPLSTDDWLPLLVLGISGAAGQVLLTAAFRRASAAIVAPLDYTHMIWAVVYGLTIWGYLPGWRVWIGAAVIVLSGMFIIYRENRLRLKRIRLATSP
jgi:drug/metabolite transporter (DMT)-like permease